MSDLWYEIVDHKMLLTQGDLIFDCPLLAWQGDSLRLEGEGSSTVLENAMGAIQADIVVMTQACDIEQEKVENDELLCRVDHVEHGVENLLLVLQFTVVIGVGKVIQKPELFIGLEIVRGLDMHTRR